MKSVRTFFWVLLLLLPVASWGEMFPLLSQSQDSTGSKSGISALADVIPLPYNIAIGGGSEMFSVGTDLLITPLSVMYVNEASRPDSVHGPWVPSHVFLWTNRIRMIYDYDNHQYGFFLQPNIRYLYRFLLADVAIGPEIGWQTKTGFDWGASIRLNGLLTLCLADLEFGYFANTKKYYFNVLFDLSIKMIML